MLYNSIQMKGRKPNEKGDFPMTTKSSLNYMKHPDYIALYYVASVTRSGSLKEQAESKKIVNRSETYFFLLTSDQAIRFVKEYPTFWTVDDENGIGWKGKGNTATVMEAAKKVGAVIVPLNLKHKDVPKLNRGNRSDWLEQKACELVSVMTGESFEWTGHKVRAAHGAYNPDGVSASGKKLEVKGVSSVMSSKSAKDVKEN